MESTNSIKRRIISAGRAAVNELIKIAQEPIISGRLTDENTTDDGLAADKITRAAQAKKIAIMDAFEILERVEREEAIIEAAEGTIVPPAQNFVESKSKKN